MQKNIYLPQVELDMESVTVVCWLVSVGDRVEIEQPILEIETQKAVMDVPSSDAGFVRQLCVAEGDEVPEKSLICVLTDTANEPLNEPASTSTASAESIKDDESTTKQAVDPINPVKASPAARKMARVLGVDLSTVTGTGPQTRITTDDIQAAKDSCQENIASEGWMPIPSARLALIEQMQKSLAEIPQFQVSRQIVVTPLIHSMDDFTFTDRLIQCVARALAVHPTLRTQFKDNCTHVEPVSVAVAMETEHGLVAPVIRDAHNRSLEEVSAMVKDFRDRAGRQSLKVSELKGGLFAVSNLGMFGVDQFTPFVFHSQTAVLAIGCAVEASGNSKMAWFTLGVDHRIVNGAEAARFLETLQKEIREIQ